MDTLCDLDSGLAEAGKRPPDIVFWPKEKGQPPRAVCPILGRLAADNLFHRADAHAQAGLVARSGVLVQRPLLDRLVEGGYGLAVHLLGGCLVAFFDGLAQKTQLGTQTGGVGAVAHGAAFGLARTFQR